MKNRILKTGIPVFICLFIFSMPALLHGQAWKWEKKIYTSYGIDAIQDMAVDQSGNMYILVFDSSYVFKGQDSAQYPDPALVKLDSMGNLVWHANIHPQSALYTFKNNKYHAPFLGKIKIAASGHVYVCGNLPGGLSFGAVSLPVSSDKSYKNETGTVWSNVFMAECDGNGAWLQAKILARTTSAGFVQAIAMDHQNNIYININYYDTIISSSHNFAAQNNQSSFLGCFDSTGNEKWSQVYSGILNVNSYGSMTIDANNHIYLSSQLDPSDSVTVKKISSAGQLVFAKKIASPFFQSYDMAIDRLGNIYLAGFCLFPIDFGNGIPVNKANTNTFILKYDSSFNLKWVQTIAAEGSVNITRISVDLAGRVYITGSFSNLITLGDSTYYSEINTPFIASYTGNGQMISGYPLPGGYGLGATGTNIQIDGAGMVYTTGNFFNYISFGCNSLSTGFDYNTEFSYLARLDPRPPVISKQPYCTGDSLICASAPALYHNCRWVFNNGTILSGQRVACTNPPKGYYHFVLYATNTAGCQVVISDSFRHPAPPVPAFTMHDTLGCQYTRVDVNNTSTADTMAQGNWPQTQWDFGDGTPPITTSAATKQYPTAGNFTIRLSYSNGFCRADTNILLAVHTRPRPGFRVSDTAGCTPLTVQITDTGSVTVSSAYALFGKGGADSNANTITYTRPGSYKIVRRLTGQGGCLYKDSVPVHVHTGINQADKTDISAATVTGTGTVSVSWPATPGAAYYVLARTTDNDSTNAGRITITTPSASYQDSNVDVNRHTYAYTAIAADSCANLEGTGRMGQTMKLGGTENPGQQLVLRWDPYRQWASGVKNYQVYHKDVNGNFELVSTVQDTALMITTPAPGNQDNQCYQVTAISGDNQYSAASNVFCFGQRQTLYVPNAFTPNGDGLNDRFNPVVSGISQWQMTIVDRWGGLVYACTEKAPVDDTTETQAQKARTGWDGTFKGLPAPAGVYIYIIIAEDMLGHAVNKKGNVTLVR